MMMNLFSTFDPCTGMLSMNWMSMMLMFILPVNFWMTPSKLSLILMEIHKKISLEVIMHTKNIKNTIMFVSMFTYILINNIMGLFPYIFTASSHLVFSLSLALSMWLAMMMFGWTKKTNSMFSHLVPVGTPGILMPFMVLIESISNLIRPGSLAVRLSANMIAGHLLMTLLGNSLTSSIMMMMFMWMLMALIMFETAVAFIQSYVFMTLSTLYSSEI